jgi:type I restriction enzyme, S subunit
MKCDWHRRLLSSIAVEIIDGDRGKEYPKHEDFSDKGYCLFLNTNNVRPDGFNFANCQFVSEEKDQKLRKGKLFRNDLVMTTRGTIGNVAYYDENVPFENVRINSGMVIFRTDASRLSPNFLYQFLRSPDFVGQTVSLKSGVAQPQFPIRDIKRVEIPIPELTTQIRIAEILSAYDDLIENNRRRMKLLEESARQLYQEWFVRLRFPGHEHARVIDGVPAGWERTTAFSAMDILSGGTPKTQKSDYWDGDIPFYTPKDAAEPCYVYETERSITEVGLNSCNSRLYPINTVFISARGTVGKLNLASKPMAMSQSCYALLGKEHVSQFFLFCALREAVDHFRQHAVGAVFDAIIVGTFKQIPFMVPDEKSVKLFEDAVTPVFQQVANLMEQNQKLRASRDLLLPRLMNGEITV